MLIALVQGLQMKQQHWSPTPGFLTVGFHCLFYQCLAHRVWLFPFLGLSSSILAWLRGFPASFHASPLRFRVFAAKCYLFPTLRIGNLHTQVWQNPNSSKPQVSQGQSQARSVFYLWTLGCGAVFHFLAKFWGLAQKAAEKK